MTGISEAMGSGFGRGVERDRATWNRSRSDQDVGSNSREGEYINPEEENSGVLLETLSVTLRRLREISRRSAMSRKGKEVERGDEPWDCLTRVADMLKKATGLRQSLSVTELVNRLVSRTALSKAIPKVIQAEYAVFSHIYAILRRIAAALQPIEC